MALLVTGSDFLASAGDFDRALSAETDRVNALPDGSIAIGTLRSFGAYIDRARAFLARARVRAGSGSVFVAPSMSDEDEELRRFETELRAFEDTFAKAGFPPPAFLVPRDSPEHPDHPDGPGGSSPFSLGIAVVGGIATLGIGLYVWSWLPKAPARRRRAEA